MNPDHGRSRAGFVSLGREVEIQFFRATGFEKADVFLDAGFLRRRPRREESQADRQDRGEASQQESGVNRGEGFYHGRGV